MIEAFFLSVRVHLSARLVDTFLGHFELTVVDECRTFSLSGREIRKVLVPGMIFVNLDFLEATKQGGAGYQTT